LEKEVRPCIARPSSTLVSRSHSKLATRAITLAIHSHRRPARIADVVSVTEYSIVFTRMCVTASSRASVLK
jgi:hypothetical protein